MNKPLDGVTVLDFTTALAGPYCTLLLAGLGARVIKIENPRSPDTARGNSPYLGADGLKATRTRDDDVSLAMLERGRNKWAVTLDLKHPQSQQVYADLVARADAIVENFSAGTADRLGIGYARAAAINPRIVYTSISGFGADAQGSAQNKAMDTIVQALSGLMLTSGEPGQGPVRVGVPFGDLAAPLFATIGTLAALMQARATGQGQQVDVSLLGALSALVACEPFDAMQRTGQEARTGNAVPRLGAFGVFACADGHVAICAPTDTFSAGLFAAMGREDLSNDARFASRDQRVANSQALYAEIDAWAAGRTTADAVRALEAQGVPAAPVRSPAEAMRDPRLLRRGETVRLEHPVHGDVGEMHAGGLPIRMSGARTGFDAPPPGLGEHNDAVYGQLLGYPADKRQALREQGVI
ncbi:MAG TPA: CoA transferase [Rhizobacter sp.]